jgi:hypothetical protein
MDTKTAARNWGLTQRTVQEYCKNQLIPGVRQNAQKQYIIPDNTQKPYLPHVYTNRTAADDRFDILNALYLDAYLSPKALSIPDRRFEDMLVTLRKAKLIALRKRGDEPTELANYHLTNQGIDVMEAQDARKSFMVFWRRLLLKDDA